MIISRFYLISTILLLSIIVLVSGCTQKLNNITEQAPRVDIYYSFGTQAENNILDTKNNLYVKALTGCNPPSKEYAVKLSNAEKTSIYNSILENGLLKIKSNYTENCDGKGRCKGVIPYSSGTLTVFIDGETKTFKYSSDYFNEDDPDFKKLGKFRGVISDIIQQKEKEMNIQKPCVGII